jgi:hypothetical protein
VHLCESESENNEVEFCCVCVSLWLVDLKYSDFL